jgi:hypothetical protein
MMATVKLDLKKDLKHLYNPSAKNVSEVDVPPMNFLMIDGKGDPNNSSDYQQAVSTLYALSFTLKFICKQQGVDFTVMPLEGLWVIEGATGLVEANFDKGRFQWTMMILQPDPIDEAMVKKGMETVRAKKNPPALDKIRFERYTEGKAVQIMHIGPYSAEAPTVARLHEYVTAHGYRLSGKHHEIYLSNPNTAAPEKMKTVIRQPYS